MLSEHTSIDDFFRNKEEDFVPDNSREEAHWRQMKTMLAGKQTTPPHKRRYKRRRVVRYIYGCAVIVLVTTVAVTTYRHKKTGTVSKHMPIPTYNNNMAAVTPVKPTTSAAATRATIPVGTPKHTTSATVKHKPSAAMIAKVPTAPGNTDTSTKNIPATAPDAATLLKLFYQQLEPQPQEFIIQPERDTTLVAHEGTRLLIPAGAFRDKKGISPSGPIKIILTEFYSYDKMVAVGLGTSSYGKQLVSGGMIHVTAEADGQELQIQPAVNITVKMPTNNYDPGMQLFVGAPPVQSPLPEYTLVPHMQGDTPSVTPVKTAGSKSVNWIPTNQWAESYRRPQVKVWDVRNRPAFVTYNKRATATFHIKRNNPVKKEVIKKELEKRYGYYYDRIKIKYFTNAHWEVFSNRNGVEKVTVGDSVFLDFDEALRSKLISTQDSLAYMQKMTADSIRYFSGVGKIKKEYTFNISGLGWMNCDRFLNDPRPKIDFTLRLGQNHDAGNSLPVLLFTRFRSLMTGAYGENKLCFFKVPEDEPVYLIYIGVKNGKVISCIQPFTVSAAEADNLHFEETTPEQFKIKLKALNLISEN